MTSAPYSDAIRDAYKGRTPEDVVFAVKQVIINQIRSLDSQVEIQSTDFFNHTFAPDFILTWRRDATSRQLYIRTDASDLDAAEDLKYVEAKSPVVFSLEPADLTMERAQSRPASSRQSEILVTDTLGLSEITDRKAESRVLEIASPSLLQGGRGLLDRERSERVADGITRGFIAAGSLAQDETGHAVRVIDEFFRATQSSRLTRFLQAVWIGAGGSLSSFPASTTLDDGLSAEVLSFLLQFRENLPVEFWRRVGSQLTIEKLNDLTNTPSANFDALINANLDRIESRACRIDPLTTFLSHDAPRTRWAQGEKELTWRGDTFTASLAEAKKNVLRREDPEEGAGIGGAQLDDVTRRAVSSQVLLQQVEIATSATRTMQYGSTSRAGDAGIADDEELQVLLANLGGEVRVRRAIATSPGMKPLVFDYEKSIASGRSSAKFSALDLLDLAAHLLTDLTEKEQTLLRELRTSLPTKTEPLRLF